MNSRGPAHTVGPLPFHTLRFSMNNGLKVAKVIVDAIVNAAKLIEDQDPSAVVLKGVRRSIQLDRHSCGLQCVRVILHYYGRGLPISRLEGLLDTDADGTSIGAIRRVLRQRGLTTKIVVDARLQDLRRAIDQGHPALISTEGGEHWSVVYGFSSGHLFVCDSSLKFGLRCRWQIVKFRRLWDGWMMSMTEKSPTR
jgi:ABC-type bacteriocin/lantibiotic exporter with double-glycine peptidase domain